MLYDEAKRYKMPLGDYKGKALDDVASTDAGLKYLDWLSGQGWVRDRLRVALTAYLEDPSIAKEVEDLPEFIR